MRKLDSELCVCCRSEGRQDSIARSLRLSVKSRQIKNAITSVHVPRALTRMLLEAQRRLTVSVLRLLGESIPGRKHLAWAIGAPQIQQRNL